MHFIVLFILIFILFIFRQSWYHAHSSRYNLSCLFVDIQKKSMNCKLLIYGIGLAYGALTSLNPVNGIYTSFYTGLVYILFGTSRHLSPGVYGITSLMVLATINKFEHKYASTDTALQAHALSAVNSMNLTHSALLANSTGESTFISSNLELKLKISSSLTFWCGTFQVNSCEKRGLLKKIRFTKPICSLIKDSYVVLEIRRHFKVLFTAFTQRFHDCVWIPRVHHTTSAHFWHLCEGGQATKDLQLDLCKPKSLTLITFN